MAKIPPIEVPIRFTIVGEDGPELVIALDGSDRSRQIMGGVFANELAALLELKLEQGQTFAADMDGVIITVEPTPEQKDAIAQPGGEPAERLHITLAYLGAVDGDLDREAIEEAVADVAGHFPPLEGEVSGLGSFGKDGTEGITLGLVDAPGLGRLRQNLIDRLKEGGVEIVEEHDFQPHITLNYGPIPDGATPVGLPLSLNSLTLRWGAEIVDVGLVGPTEEELAVAEETPSGEDEEMAPVVVAVFDIVEDSEDCAERSDGEATVALVDPESGEIISCHVSVEEAQAALDLLIEAMDDLEEDAHHDEDEETSQVSPEQWASILEFMEAVATDLAERSDADFAAIAAHDSPTSTESWDGPANEKSVTSPSDESYFGDIYAWRDDEADTEVKAAYRFIHHFVGEDGSAGAASTVACSTGIGVLNGGRGGTTIPDSGREGVYEHLAAHLRDADLEPPELMSADDAAVVALAVQEGVQIDPSDHEFMAGIVTIYRAENAVEAADETLDVSVSEFGALPSHDTPTVNPPTFQGWNGEEAEKRVRSGEDVSYYGKMFAWRDEDRDPSSKGSYKFIHHEVDQQGTPGAAVMWATHSAIAVIDDSSIPTADYKGVYNHLARHLRDGGVVVPELGEAKPIEDVESAIREMRAQWFARVAELAAKRDVAELGDGELIGEIVHRWVEQSQSSMTPELQEELEVELGLKDEETQELASDVVIEAAVGDEEDTDTPGADPDELEEGIVVEGDFSDGEFEWEGVLIVEGLPSGDGRQIDQGALIWRELPLPLMLQTINAEGHDGAVIAGSIHEIERVGQEIVGRGFFDSGDDGQSAKRLITEGTMRGVSADIDKVKIEFQDPSGGEVDPLDAMLGGVDALQVLIEGRIMGATLTPFPAFQEAQVRVIDATAAADDEALVASGYEAGDVWRVPSLLKIALRGESVQHLDIEALVASGAAVDFQIPVHPPTSWFELEGMDSPEEFQVFADGRVYGLIARWGSCHIGFSDRCVSVPRTKNNFSAFHKPGVLTEEGDQVLCGPIYMDTVHPNLRLVASDAEAHYADTGCAVADVHLYENEWGIVAAGAVRSSAAPAQVQALRGSDVSPDWRKLNKNLEVVGLLAVNLSGFIVQDSLVASAGRNPQGVFDSVSGDLQSLVAAGMVQHRAVKVDSLKDEVAELRAEIDELRSVLRPIRAERVAARLLAMSASVDHHVATTKVEPEEAATEEVEELASEEAACPCGDV